MGAGDFGLRPGGEGAGMQAEEPAAVAVRIRRWAPRTGKTYRRGRKRFGFSKRLRSPSVQPTVSPLASELDSRNNGDGASRAKTAATICGFTDPDALREFTLRNFLSTSEFRSRFTGAAKLSLTEIGR